MCHHPPTSCLLLRGYWWANGNGSRNHISPLFMKTEKWAINSIQRQEEMEIGAQNRRPWIRAGKSNADNNKYGHKNEKITTFLYLFSTVGATCGFSRAPILPFVSTYRHTCVSLSFSLSGGFFPFFVSCSNHQMTRKINMLSLWHLPAGSLGLRRLNRTEQRIK